MLRTVVLALLSLSLVAAIIYQPGEAFSASLQGLTIWWSIVFPGLLPFLTMLELMLAFGFIHGCGTLLEPLTRRFFRLPGESALALVTGWTGGFIAGAEAAAALRKQNRVTAKEGQRLLAITHMPNPLFVLLVVGAGFLHRPELGASLLITLWLTGIAAAWLSRFYLKENQPAAHAEADAGSPPGERPDMPLLRRAAAAMNEARLRDGRSFGKVLGDSVTVSVTKLMAVGGFMMLASVIVKLANNLLELPFSSMILSGIMEHHLGAYAGASTAFSAGGFSAPQWQLACMAAFLAWGGVSALLQAGHAISRTDLSLIRLALSRVLHAGLAFILSLFISLPLAKWIGGLMENSTPALLRLDISPGNLEGGLHLSDLPDLWPYVPMIIALFSCAVLFITGIGWLTAEKRTPSN